MSLFQTIIPSINRPLSRGDSDGSHPAAPSVKPAYEIRETNDAYGVTVYLPGVVRDAVELTAEDGQFRITARRAWRQPEGWTALYRESSDAAYELVLAHDNTVDAARIVAELRDGVLSVSLPKTEAVKPRKIVVA
jgi:HSP20 family protein